MIHFAFLLELVDKSNEQTSPTTDVWWIPLATTIGSVLVSLCTVFGPPIAKKIFGSGGESPAVAASLAKDSAKVIADNLKATTKLLSDSMGAIQASSVANSAKLDELVAIARK